MIKSFPFTSIGESLEVDDFYRFRGGFSQAVLQRVPTAGTVQFLTEGDSLANLSIDRNTRKKVESRYRTILRGDATVDNVSGIVLLGFQAVGGTPVVACISDMDPLVVKGVASDWLEDARDDLTREFYHIKRGYQDPETGLLNSAHLFSVLRSIPAEEKLQLMLVEIPPRSKTLRDAFRNAQEAAAALTGRVDRSSFMVHHLGQSVFALLSRLGESGTSEQLISALVQFLKQEGFYRVHIGSSSTTIPSEVNDRLPIAQHSLLDEAWTALQTATTRGPFSFCEYSLLVNAHHHPLYPPDPTAVRRLRRISKNDSSFCLIKLSAIPPSGQTSQICELTGLSERHVFSSEGGLYIYLSSASGAEGQAFAEKLVKEVHGLPGMSEVYVGLSVFPHKKSNKTQTFHDVQKALLHAAFFGPGSVVLFDAVSLNVSGDIYFSDGDLPRAVREYRRGLEIDPSDINLLNSLGVTYALMNKNAHARRTFESVLELDPLDYMALYNLGLEAQQRNDLHNAINRFTKALQLCEKEEGAVEIRTDLKIQLGQLYCRTGSYQQALNYLNEWASLVPERQHGRVAAYLGEAYLECEDTRSAMTWLQRALQHNEFDHNAMSLLGSAILKAGEGDEIALSLCMKSVELAPENKTLHLRLAAVLMQMDKFEVALDHLKQCRGKAVDHLQVQLLKAKAYKGLQQAGRARYWLKRVMDQADQKSKEYLSAQEIFHHMCNQGSGK